jgi:ribonuclease Z
MEIEILGTSEATPTARKGQTSIILNYSNENILIDCGEGTQRQMKIAGFNLCKITRILITHWHADHILGIPGMLQTMVLSNYSKALHIYGPRGTKKYMDLILGMFIFYGKLNVEVHEIVKDGIFLETDDFALSAYKMTHMAPCLAYSFAEKDRRRIKMDYLKKIGLKPGPLVGQLQKGKTIEFNKKKISPNQATSVQKGKKIAFILDTAINENCIKIAKDADLLISEATFLESEHADKAEERGHLTAKQAGTIAKQAKAGRLLLTHISQRYARDESGILAEAKKVFKNSELARDFMKIKL